MRICLPVVLLGLIFSCQRSKEHAGENSKGLVSSDSTILETKATNPTSALHLYSGLYKGGLRLAVAGDIVVGYYETSSGWNEAVQAPLFSCAYSFKGQYTGADDFSISLLGHDSVWGKFEILPAGKIIVTLPMNPCENEEPSRQVWELQRSYPLLSIKAVMAERSHFHSSPEPNAARKAYLIKGDRVEVTAVHGEWYQVSFSGPKATTTGWMSASAFSEHNVKGALHGTWISKIGQPYSVFYRFYPDNRYKTWDINSFEPQAMTGKYRVEPSGEISLAPCGESGQSIRYKEPSDGELAMMLPGTNTWTAFEKRTEPGDLEQAAFSIEKRRIKTTVNNRIHYIPSSGSKEQFLRAVCPFYVSSGVLLRGEGEFPILTVSTFDKIPLFDAIVDNDQVTGLVIRDKRINFAGISIGSTFMELRRAIPAAAVTRSEMEGRIVGSTEDFSYSFGHSLLFNDSVKTLPDTVTIKEIVL